MVRPPCSGPSYSVFTCVLTKALVVPLVPAQVLGRPAVVEVLGAVAMPVAVSRWKGSSTPPGRRARPGRTHRACVRVVVEAPHPRIGAEVVVEGSVLLHEEHDVLDRAQVGAGRLRRAPRNRAMAARAESLHPPAARTAAPPGGQRRQRASCADRSAAIQLPSTSDALPVIRRFSVVSLVVHPSTSDSTLMSRRTPRRQDGPRDATRRPLLGAHPGQTEGGAMFGTTVPRGLGQWIPWKSWYRRSRRLPHTVPPTRRCTTVPAGGVWATGHASLYVVARRDRASRSKRAASRMTAIGPRNAGHVWTGRRS